jgi:iron complex outermembrane receptor protein
MAQRSKRKGCFLTCIFFCIPVLAQQFEPQTTRGADVTAMDIQELMTVKVTSASKKEQKLSRPAAAIFVITQEDIRRSGAANIPDVLRMVPGMNVAQITGSNLEFEDVNGALQSSLIRWSGYAKVTWRF